MQASGIDLVTSVYSEVHCNHCLKGQGNAEICKETWNKSFTLASSAAIKHQLNQEMNINIQNAIEDRRD